MSSNFLMQALTVLKHQRIGRLFNCLQMLIELAQCDNWFAVLGVWVPSTLALFLHPPQLLLQPGAVKKATEAEGRRLI